MQLPNGYTKIYECTCGDKSQLESKIIMRTGLTIEEFIAKSNADNTSELQNYRKCIYYVAPYALVKNKDLGWYSFHCWDIEKCGGYEIIAESDPTITDGVSDPFSSKVKEITGLSVSDFVYSTKAIEGDDVLTYVNVPYALRQIRTPDTVINSNPAGVFWRTWQLFKVKG